MKILGSHSFLLTATLLSIFFGCFLVAHSLAAVDYAATARGVDLFLVTPDPDSGTLQNTYVVFTNDQTPLNAMEVEILFDPASVQVADFTFFPDLCEERFVIDRTIDNTAGVLHASCGTITAFNGTIGVFGSLTLEPLTDMPTELTFGAHTNVYIHDGKGSQILRYTYNTTVSGTPGV